jgi:PhnB protein
MMSVQPIPEGYQTLTPSIVVDNATEAIDFYKRAFGAEERLRMDGPGGTIAHAELQIGDSVLMLNDPFPQATTKPPKEIGGTTTTLVMYVEDVDAVVQQAIDAGATVAQPVEDQFWGDRYGTVLDPYGHSWGIATHVEDVAPEEIAERAKTAMAETTAIN